jgi:hypothetical protein
MNDDDQPPQRVSKGALIAMGAILVTLTLVAAFANWRNAHRDQIESVTITRFTPSPSPRATP